jgi:hypothetical protein
MAERAMSRIPEASEVDAYAPLEAPEGYAPNGNGHRAAKRRLILPLLILSFAFFAISLLWRKS